MRREITNQFLSGWDNGNSNYETEIAYDNQWFESDNYAEWVRLNIRFTDSIQESLGPFSFERRGIVLIEVFVGNNIGVERRDELTFRVRDIFEGKRIIGIDNGWFSPVFINDRGVSDNWFESTIEAHFKVWETK